MKLSGETKLLAIMGAVVAVGGGVMLALNAAPSVLPSPAPQPTPAPEPWTSARFDAILKNARHMRGDANAPITVVEFADFQCPSCRRAFANTISSLDKKAPAPVRFVFRHFPLKMHERALPAAIATEAAARQNKFWEMYDALFTGETTELTDDYIKVSAQKIGLNLAQFEKDLKDPALKALVEADEKLGLEQKITMTPTFVVRTKSGVQFAQGGDQFAAALAGKPLPPLPQ